MYPTNDTWFLVHIDGRPITGRLSGVLMATRNDAGKAVLHVIDQANPVVELDETWEEWVNILFPKNVIAEPDVAQPKLRTRTRLRK